ncbi:Fur-regulated basic protein FbpA [Niallia sp. NCCP-28]|uniref:Fur-regulated basic protein FbpA n=1 Tax=Niallia sp. NCCP-28 TaxID=2934712 RepID=UPI0020C16913|nr:Fur-regulated basic protein FbpA [Niallia sp. NCCP-28]
MNDQNQYQYKEELIAQLLHMDCFKSSDDRQLYELTIDELQREYQAVMEWQVEEIK